MLLELGTHFTCFTGTEVQILALLVQKYNSDRMTVKNFQMLLELSTYFTCFTGRNVQILTRKALLDDEALVTCTSTSPMAEAASFAPDMRACLRKLVQYPSSALLFAPRSIQLSS